MIIKKPSLEEENAFMDDLLSGLDADDFFNQTPSSPLKSPIKSGHTPSITKKSIGTASPKTPARKRLNKTAHATPRKLPTQGDLDALVEGAEDWDWDDMLSSPLKGGSTVCQLHDSYAFLGEVIVSQ
jgi:DNA replication ATP-dependent helicase Dna2